MFFGKVLKHEGKPLVYVGMIDGTESLIPIDSFIQFASEMLKEASLFRREKDTSKKFREHSSESRFDYIEYDEEDMILKIYTKDKYWCPFEDDECESWIAIDDVDYPLMCLVKDYIHDSFQGFCNKMKERVR